LDLDNISTTVTGTGLRGKFPKTATADDAIATVARGVGGAQRCRGDGFERGFSNTQSKHWSPARRSTDAKINTVVTVSQTVRSVAD
jgi:hypothetical protein